MRKFASYPQLLSVPQIQSLADVSQWGWKDSFHARSEDNQVTVAIQNGRRHDYIEPDGSISGVPVQDFIKG